MSPRAERWSPGILLVASWLAWTAAVAAQAPLPADHGPTLRSVRIAFDTSARSSPAVGPFPLSVSVEGLRGGERIPIADAIDLTVERNVAVPAVFELTLRHPIAKKDLDQIVTTLSSAEHATDRFVFHYTLTLTFGAAVDHTVLQKVYAVTLGPDQPARDDADQRGRTSRSTRGTAAATTARARSSAPTPSSRRPTR